MNEMLLLYLFVIMEGVFILKSKSGQMDKPEDKDAFNGKAGDLHVNHATRECASEKDDEHASTR
jgi:hypothetical protein